MNIMIKDVINSLNKIKEKNGNFAIWGAGSEGCAGKAWIDNYSKGTMKPRFIVDNNPQLWGKNNVISPREFFLKMEEIDVLFICVYVADQVINQVRSGGYQAETVILLSSIMNADKARVYIANNADNYLFVKSFMADQRSIDTMDTYLEVINTSQISLWDKVNANSYNKLIEPDIVKLSDREEHFVDVGAFIGDTMEVFLHHCKGEYGSILGIEPDLSNFEALEKYISTIHDAKALRLAVSDKDGVMKLISGVSEASHIGDTGNVDIDVKRLDNIEEAQKATFIKLSTVGHEKQALIGAENIIKNNKPKLSYYCGGTQMWEIPKYLKSLVPEYKFYLRHYGYGTQAMVGFAVLD